MDVVFSGSINKFQVPGVAAVAVENQQHRILSCWFCVVNEMLKPHVESLSRHPAAGVSGEDRSGRSTRFELVRYPHSWKNEKRRDKVTRGRHTQAGGC